MVHIIQTIRERRKISIMFQHVFMLLLANSCIWMLYFCFNFGAEDIFSPFKFGFRCISPIMVDLLTCNAHSILISLKNLVKIDAILEICLYSPGVSVFYDHFVFLCLCFSLCFRSVLQLLCNKILNTSFGSMQVVFNKSIIFF